MDLEPVHFKLGSKRPITTHRTDISVSAIGWVVTLVVLWVLTMLCAHIFVGSSWLLWSLLFAAEYIPCVLFVHGWRR